MSQEQIYDQKLRPLMDMVCDICSEHKIPMLCSFAIPSDTDPDLRVTSINYGKSFAGNQDGFLRAAWLLGALIK
jgi:hypothetical protein